jgi:ubiquinone/menaquinone biosynthesis C-methylase UbiE
MTQTTWDFTPYAAFYDKRPDYSADVIKRLLDHIGVHPGQKVADIGAGTGKLIRHLLIRGLNVTAIEPNAAMRAIGIRNTLGSSVKWCEGTAEATGLSAGQFSVVTFGSSFNVTDRLKALQETARILTLGGWFICLWNHRDLSDRLQSGIEAIIHQHIPTYDYGVRREDQTQIIEKSGFFGEVNRMEERFVVQLSVLDHIEAWRSHATLARQAGQNFEAVIGAIEEYLSGRTVIEVPYYTRVWYARLKGPKSQTYPLTLKRS